MIAMILENDHIDCSNSSKRFCIMIAIFSLSYYNYFYNTPFFRDKTPFFSLIYHEKQAFFIRKGIFYGIIINIILIAFIKRSFAICLFFNKIIAMNNCLCNFFAGFRFKLYYLNFTRVPSVLFL